MYYYSWLLKTLLLPQLISSLTYIVIGYLFKIKKYSPYLIKIPDRKVYDGKLDRKIENNEKIKKKLTLNLILNSVISLIIGLLFLQILPTEINPDIYIEKTYFIMFKKVIITYVISQIVFFFTHIMFHTKFMYKHFHYVHHQIDQPFSISANYSHPVEFIFSNLPTIMTGVILTEMSWVLTCFCWLPIITIESMLEHSGYKLVYNSKLFGEIVLFDPSHHDKHHKLKMYNYSSYEFVDKFFKTFK
jgi:methylsterol monooxygenase